jgi:hypothetical protein
MSQIWPMNRLTYKIKVMQRQREQLKYFRDI